MFPGAKYPHQGGGIAPGPLAYKFCMQRLAAHNSRPCNPVRSFHDKEI